MIISHKHKFIFVKTRKTAGTSMEIALSKICGDEDIITKISPSDEVVRKELTQRTAQNERLPLSKITKVQIMRSLAKRRFPKFYDHMPCLMIKNFVSDEVWNTYYKFTIERNPFDKIVSLYYWRGGDKKYNNIYNFITKGGFTSFAGYDLYSVNGVVAVDKVYKYENLDSICDDLSKKLQLKEPLVLPEYKAKAHTRKVRNYKDILDEKSIELIKVIFAREIKLFDYQF